MNSESSSTNVEDLKNRVLRIFEEFEQGKSGKVIQSQEKYFSPMKIAVFGLGYVGSTCAACFSEIGHKVIGNDVKPHKVNRMNQGFSPVKEPRVGELISKNIGKSLKATTNIRETLENSDTGIICVGTPLNHEDVTDLSRVINVFDDIINNLSKPYTIIIRSTVPPGTIEHLRQRAKGKDVKVVMNPEFLREGKAVEDFFDPNLIVMGSEDKEATEIVKKMYYRIPGKIILTNERTAEMIKYVNNSWHALKIAFTNEISSIASKEGIEPNELMDLFCSDEKLNVSKRYHKPGFAYGGSCLTKDTSALVHMAHYRGLKIPLINSIEDSNQRHIERALKLILSTGEKNIGVFGISFKYDGSSGDVRGSPIISLINRLIEVGFLKLFDKGYDLQIYDPYIDQEELTSYLPHFKEKINNNMEEVVRNSKIILVGNTLPDLKELPDKLEKHHTVIDLQGAFKPEEIKKGEYVNIFNKRRDKGEYNKI